MKVSSASSRVTSSVSANRTYRSTSVLANTGPSRKSLRGQSRVDVFRTARSNKTLTFPRWMRRPARPQWRKLRQAQWRLGLLRAVQADPALLTVSRVLAATPAEATSRDTRVTVRVTAVVKRTRTRVLGCTMRLASRRELDAGGRFCPLFCACFERSGCVDAGELAQDVAKRGRGHRSRLSQCTE